MAYCDYCRKDVPDRFEFCPDCYSQVGRGGSQPSYSSPPKSKKLMIIGIVAAVAVVIMIIIAVVVFLVVLDSSEPKVGNVDVMMSLDRQSVYQGDTINVTLTVTNDNDESFPFGTLGLDLFLADKDEYNAKEYTVIDPPDEIEDYIGSLEVDPSSSETATFEWDMDEDPGEYYMVFQLEQILEKDGDRVIRSMVKQDEEALVTIMMPLGR